MCRTHYNLERGGLLICQFIYHSICLSLYFCIHVSPFTDLAVPLSLHVLLFLLEVC